MDKAGVICYIGVDGAATVIGLKSHNRERETRFSPPSLNRGKAAIPSESNKVKPEEGCRPKAT